MRKYLAIFISMMLVLGALSLAFGSAGIGDKKEFDSEEDEYRSETNYQDSDQEVEILDEEIRQKASARSEDEFIEVMIRLTPHGFEDRKLLKTPVNEIDTSEVTAELKDHSERKQSKVIDFLNRGNGEVLNTFWIANAILARVEVGALDRLVEFDQVWKIHENFEVQVQGPEIFENTEPQIGEGTEFLESPYKVDDEEKQETEKIDSYNTDSSSSDVTWGLERINATDVWDKGRDGSGVRVAVSDSGVDIDHPDLEGKMVTVDEENPHYPGGWIEFDMHGEIVKNSTPHDTHGHGTHVSGTVVGGNTSGTHIGVAPGADLMHALTLPGNTGYLGQLIAGMQWKVEPHDMYGEPLHEKYGGDVEDYRAHIASMSWGTPGNDHLDLFIEPVQNLRNAGVVPVACLGNDGEGTFWIPGAVYEAFGIGASDQYDNIADFSSGAIIQDERNETPEEFVKPDFAAPGVDVLSSLPGEGWDYWQGTSMAVPHVAGTIALMLHPNLSIEEIYDTLNKTADYYEDGDDLGEDKNTRYGHGIINAEEAFSEVYYLTLREPENITNNNITLKGELLEMPNQEVQVSFKYRQKGEQEWAETNSTTLNGSEKFEIDIGDLKSGTTYEYKAVGNWSGKQNVTFAESFTTHRDVEIFTSSVEDLSPENVTLRGEITDLYLEEVNVSFRYRKVGEEWSEVKVGNITEPQEFSAEVEGLEYLMPYDYKAIAKADGEEFTGDVIRFIPPAPEPEWSEEEGAYLISSAPELQWMKNDLESDYILVDDIDAVQSEIWFDGKGFEPIGKDYDNGFLGSFDGRGHVIENLSINRSEAENVGLFGYIGEECVVNDVGIEGADVTGKKYVATLAGRNKGKILNSSATGDVTGEGVVGGIVGRNIGKVMNSYARGTVAGEWIVGGLMGNNDQTRFSLGKVMNSSVRGNVTADRTVGGLVGENHGEVMNSSAMGNVTGNYTVGGLVGENHGEVMNSSAMGSVTGYFRVGGIVGYHSSFVYGYENLLKNSYFDGEVNGEISVGALVGFQRDSTIENSHYNVDEVLINGENHVTIGGLFDDQYQDWIENLELDIADYSDTLESSDGYYDISDVQGIRDLLGFAEDKEKKFRLTDDVDLSDEPGLHIPYLAADFDGNNHTISNLTIEQNFASSGGLFGYNDNATVKNIVLSDTNVSAAISVGGLVGSNKGDVVNSYLTGEVSGYRGVGGLVGTNRGTLSNSYSQGEVSGEFWWIGGLVGSNSGEVVDSYAGENVTGNGFVGGLIGYNSGEVSNTHATGNVSGNDVIGGLLGWNARELINSSATGQVIGGNNTGGLVGLNHGQIVNTYATGEVVGNQAVGGLAGVTDNEVINSYAMGDVSGNVSVGGLVGQIGSSEHDLEGFVTHSYSVGEVIGEDEESTGGLVGYLDNGKVEQSYWDTEASKMETSDGGAGLTTDEMTGESALYNMSGFDFDETWEPVREDDKDVTEDGYPILQGLDRKTQLEVQGILQSWQLKINKPVGGGTVKVDGEVITEWPYKECYDHNTEVELKAVPEDDWSLDGWSGTNKSREEITITMNEDKEITANFEEDTIIEQIRDEIRAIPGFTPPLILVAMVMALAIYKEKRSRTN